MKVQTKKSNSNRSVHPICRLLDPGDSFHMVATVRDVNEPPILWSIPFTLLLITVILAAADYLLPFIPLQVGREKWMWFASTMVTAIVASLIAEITSKDNGKSMLSMVVASAMFSLVYKNISDLFQRSMVDVVHGSIPNPILGSAVYTCVLTVIPGVLSGAVMGSILSRIPITLPWTTKEKITFIPTVIPEPPTSYEMTCNRCDHNAPFESKFCPYCGIPLTKREAPTVKYCRFCGARINYLGQYCPTCGGEIDQLSKPLVYMSQGLMWNEP